MRWLVVVFLAACGGMVDPVDDAGADAAPTDYKFCSIAGFVPPFSCGDGGADCSSCPDYCIAPTPGEAHGTCQ